MVAKFKVGEVVNARHSGKGYRITAVWPSDLTGCYTYAVRGWRGGEYYGPTRRMPESGLVVAETYVGERPQ